MTSKKLIKMSVTATIITPFKDFLYSDDKTSMSLLLIATLDRWTPHL